MFWPQNNSTIFLRICTPVHVYAWTCAHTLSRTLLHPKHLVQIVVLNFASYQMSRHMAGVEASCTEALKSIAPPPQPSQHALQGPECDFSQSKVCES